MLDSLGNRMKHNYEDRARRYLTRRTPVVIRIDGRAFHTYTKGLKKPFDRSLHEAMIEAAMSLATEAQGVKMGYVQSDEISVVLTDYDQLTTQPWFDNNQSKIETVSASIVTCTFNHWRRVQEGGCHSATFDARAFNIPESEVANYFLWRARDWVRNSVMMYAHTFFSHNELHGKSVTDVHNMLHHIGKNWATDLADWERNGTLLLQLNGLRTFYDQISTYKEIDYFWTLVNPLV